MEGRRRRWEEFEKEVSRHPRKHAEEIQGENGHAHRTGTRVVWKQMTQKGGEWGIRCRGDKREREREKNGMGC